MATTAPKKLPAATTAPKTTTAAKPTVNPLVAAQQAAEAQRAAAAAKDAAAQKARQAQQDNLVRQVSAARTQTELNDLLAQAKTAGITIPASAITAGNASVKTATDAAQKESARVAAERAAADAAAQKAAQEKAAADAAAAQKAAADAKAKADAEAVKAAKAVEDAKTAAAAISAAKAKAEADAAAKAAAAAKVAADNAAKVAAQQQAQREKIAAEQAAADRLQQEQIAAREKAAADARAVAAAAAQEKAAQEKAAQTAAAEKAQQEQAAARAASDAAIAARVAESEQRSEQLRTEYAAEEAARLAANKETQQTLQSPTAGYAEAKAASDANLAARIAASQAQSEQTQADYAATEAARQAANQTTQENLLASGGNQLQAPTPSSIEAQNADAAAGRQAADLTNQYNTQVVSARSQAELDAIIGSARGAGVEINPGYLDRAKQVVGYQEGAAADAAQKAAESQSLGEAYRSTLPAPGSERFNYLAGNQFEVNGPDGRQYRAVPGGAGTGGARWVVSDDSGRTYTDISGQGPVIPGSQIQQGIQTNLAVVNQQAQAERAAAIEASKDDGLASFLGDFLKVATVYMVGSAIIDAIGASGGTIAGTTSAGEAAGAAASMAESGATAAEIAATLEAGGVPSAAASAAAQTATGIASGAVDVAALASQGGITAETIAMANATLDPIAALNAAQGWTAVDTAYLASIGAPAALVAQAEAANVAAGLPSTGTAPVAPTGTETAAAPSAPSAPSAPQVPLTELNAAETAELMKNIDPNMISSLAPTTSGAAAGTEASIFAGQSLNPITNAVVNLGVTNPVAVGALTGAGTSTAINLLTGQPITGQSLLTGALGGGVAGGIGSVMPDFGGGALGGALGGAATNLGATAVVSLVTGQPITAGSLAGAALIGGAIGGAVGAYTDGAGNTTYQYDDGSSMTVSRTGTPISVTDSTGASVPVGAVDRLTGEPKPMAPVEDRVPTPVDPNQRPVGYDPTTGTPVVEAPVDITSYGQGDTPGQVSMGTDGEQYLTLDSGKVVKLSEYQAAIDSGQPISVDGQIDTQFRVEASGVPKYAGMPDAGAPPEGYEVAKPGDVNGPDDSGSAQNPYKPGTYYDLATNTWFTPVTTAPAVPIDTTGIDTGPVIPVSTVPTTPTTPTAPVYTPPDYPPLDVTPGPLPDWYTNPAPTPPPVFVPPVDTITPPPDIIRTMPVDTIVPTVPPGLVGPTIPVDPNPNAVITPGTGTNPVANVDITGGTGTTPGTGTPGTGTPGISVPGIGTPGTGGTGTGPGPVAPPGVDEPPEIVIVAPRPPPEPPFIPEQPPTPPLEPPVVEPPVVEPVEPPVVEPPVVEPPVVEPPYVPPTYPPIYVPPIDTPPVKPGYEPITPLDWGKGIPLDYSGLNPGYITNVPQAYAPSGVRSQYYWGQHPYQTGGPTGQVFDRSLYNQTPAAPVQPWGLQQMYNPQTQTIANLLKGVGQASQMAPYNIPRAPKV